MSEELERFECPDCGKMLTKTASGKLRSHKCVEKEAEPQEQPQQTGAVTVEAVMVAYIKTRDEIAEKKKRFENSVADLKEVQTRRGNWLKGQLETLGVESLSKKGVGSVFIDWKDSAKLDDPHAFKQWVGEDYEGRAHFLESKVSKTALKELLADNAALPPGATYTRIKDVKVRRA